MKVVGTRIDGPLEMVFDEYLKKHPKMTVSDVITRALKDYFESSFKSEEVVLDSLISIQKKVDDAQIAVETLTEFQGYFLKAFLSSIPDPSNLSDEKRRDLADITSARYEKFITNFITFLQSGNGRLCSQITERVFLSQRDYSVNTEEGNNDRK